MSGTMDILIREMTMEDYGQVYDLWTEIKGFGIRSLDDSKEGVERFLKGTLPPAWWLSRMAMWWATSCAATMEGPDVFTMCALLRVTESMGLVTGWCALPWRPFRRRA